MLNAEEQLPQDSLTSKIDAYRCNHDAWKRAAFVDRGLDGIVAGYSDAEGSV